jgi:hypothetical protein
MSDQQILISVEQLDQLTDQWAQQAGMLEYLHGENDPAAKAFRYCISSTAKLIELTIRQAKEVQTNLQ